MSFRWGIVSTGNIARQFCRGLATLPGHAAAVVGSRSPDSADAFGDEFGIPERGDYDAVFAADVDAVYVATPNSTHHDLTLAALAAGKHVLCEKPLATSAAEAEAMFDAAGRADRLLVEAFMYRCHPQTAAVLDVVRGGRLGKVRLVRASFCYRTRKTAADQNVRFDAALAGGALMDVGCYCLDMIMQIAGAAPADVAGFSDRIDGVDVASAGTLRFDGGLLATFHCGLMTQADNTLHVGGEEGHLSVPIPWKPPETRYTIAQSTPPKQDGGGAAQGPEDVVRPVADDLYALEAEAFAAAVRDGRPPFMPRGDSLRLARVLEALRRPGG